MTLTKSAEQKQKVTIVKPMPRWQRGVIYAVLGGVVGFFATQQVPETENKFLLILVATVGAPIAYNAGVTYSLKNPPYTKEDK